MSRLSRVPDMPREARCANRRCSAAATTYNELGEIIVRRDGVFEAVEWVCPRHKTNDTKDST